MIWFVISIILLLFSAAVTGVALSNNVKGAGIGLIPGLVGLLRSFRMPVFRGRGRGRGHPQHGRQSGRPFRRREASIGRRRGKRHQIRHP
ncbi:MAG: hypothetical protein ACLRX0_09410 [Collinsella aerofaciens]